MSRPPEMGKENACLLDRQIMHHDASMQMRPPYGAFYNPTPYIWSGTRNSGKRFRREVRAS